MRTTVALGMRAVAFLASFSAAVSNAQTTSARPADDLVRVKGRVLGPTGAPVGGAKLYLRPFAEDRDDAKPRATSAAGGEFEFTFRKSEIAGADHIEDPWKFAQVIATAEGLGLDWVDGSALSADTPVTLRLVEDDAPVEGTIEDLEGRPLAGIVVRPTLVRAPKDGRLDGFIEAFRSNPFGPMFGSGEPFRAASAPLVPHELKTDDRGRFRLTGVGRERVVSLEITGPTVQHLTIHVTTRAGINFRRIDRSSQNYKELLEAGAVLPVVYGNKFHHLANPTRPIVGTVREKGTSMPLADVFVTAFMSGRESSAQALTDADGRYRLMGLPSDGKIRVLAVTEKGRPYLKQTISRSIGSADVDPVTVDFELSRGVLMRGRMTDAATGKPVRGSVTYLAFSDNPFVGKVPEIGADGPGVLTQKDGSYAIVGLPGPGVLAARAAEDRFTMSRPEQWGQPPDENGFYSTAQMGLVLTSFFHRVVRVDPAETAATIEKDLALEPGITVTGTLVDPHGQPVEHGYAFGLGALAFGGDLNKNVFVATGLERDRPRRVWFLNAKRTLGRMLTLPGEDRGPLTVVCQPCGVLSGRVVDRDGRPRPNVGVSTAIDAKPIGIGHQQSRTDSDGRFRITGLLPDLTYRLNVADASASVGEITIRSGEVKDLGDLGLDDRTTR